MNQGDREEERKEAGKTMRRVKARFRLIPAAAAIGVLVYFTIGADCKKPSPDGQGGDDGKTAGIVFRLKVEGPDSIALKDYQIVATWHGDLKQGIGSAGNANPFDIQKTYSGQTDISGDYVVQQMAGNERPGTWHFQVTTDLLAWSAECQQDLVAGQPTNINFTHSKPGCTTGLTFP